VSIEAQEFYVLFRLIRQTNWSTIGSLHGRSVNIAICILILSLDPRGGAAGLSVELKDVLT
jgi:hypothetical protein